MGKEQVVLEVTGYARGRQMLDKQLARVRINEGSYRKARSADFDQALEWLQGQGYELAQTVGPGHRMGTATVRYIYQKPEAPEAEERDEAWTAMRRRMELDAVMAPYNDGGC